MHNDMFPQQVRSFITDNYLYGQDKQFDDGDSFLEHGIIDSTAVLELVAFLEENYGITVEDNELTPDNLDSVNSISAYLRRKLNGTAATFSPAARTA
jgi:acyl carrier protein